MFSDPNSSMTMARFVSVFSLCAVETVRSFFRKRAGHWLHYFKWIQGTALFLAALFAPPDILDEMPLLGGVLAGVVERIPSASSFVARSGIPQVSTLVLGIGWGLAPLNFLFGLLFPETMHRNRPRRLLGTLWEIKPDEVAEGTFFFSLMAMLVVIPVLLWFFLRVPIFSAQFGAVDDAFHSHELRAGLGLVGQVISNGCGFLAAFWVLLAGHLVGTFMRK